MQTEIVAMILAGGKGTRLESLTKKMAKSAVFFGGKYRIIDFTMSNCAHSGINNVWVLTQYESISLNNYIGNGSHWGIDGNRSKTGVLTPRQHEDGISWYQGTADAIYQNLEFIDEINPKYVIILSGDQIYKMNYAKMLAFHREKNADVTIASITVEKKDVSRFGILKFDENRLITAFIEKPTASDSLTASMGIYIFNYDILKKVLISNKVGGNNNYDFGKNIIPYILEQKLKVYAFPYVGYWRDVGTIESLWRANMDLIDGDPLGLYADDSFKILSEDTRSLPQYIGHHALISDSIINQGVKCDGKVFHSVIFTDVIIEEGAEIYDSVIMPGAIIRRDAIIHKAIIASGVEVIKERKINPDNKKIVLIGK